MTIAPYDHWLVTKGKFPLVAGKHGYVPLVLAKKTVGLKELTRLVQAEVARRTNIFLSDRATAMDAIKASTRPYVIDLLNNLWLSDVRVSHDDSRGDGELAVIWTLVGSGRRVPHWQGPADGVIPTRTPVTIHENGVEPTPFKIIDV